MGFSGTARTRGDDEGYLLDESVSAEMSEETKVGDEDGPKDELAPLKEDVPLDTVSHIVPTLTKKIKNGKRKSKTAKMGF